MQKRPNVLVIILDALRAANVSGYGYEKQTTPRLDAFAAENVLFRQAYTTTTWTVPSHASMLSGLYLSQHRIENIERNRRFNPSIVPLPSALRPAGYRSAAFSHNILFSPAHHFDFFDEFYGLEDLPGSNWILDLLGKNGRQALRSQNRLVRYLEKVSRPRVLFEAMQDWMWEREADEPFFLMANVINVHYGWTPPPDILLKQIGPKSRFLLKPEYATLKPWQFNSGLQRVTEQHRQIWQALYDAAVMHVDRELGRFFDRMSRWEGWQDTIVVVTSDHGEMLGDYGDIVGHMLSLHDNIMRVPLVVKHPDYAPGTVVENVVQTLDLFPSVIEWAGVPAEMVLPAQMQRAPFSQAMKSPDRRSGYAFAEEDYTDSYDVLGGLMGANPKLAPDRYPRRQLAVHSDANKYIWYDDRPGEFYDLASDPGERVNLYAEDEGDLSLEELCQALDAWRSGLRLFPPQNLDDPGEIDDEVLARLTALGYIA